ncbi:MAG: GNAT family N-acetyltransferase [Microgenomates group bacterium]
MSNLLTEKIEIKRAEKKDLEKIVNLVADFYSEEERLDPRAITAGKEKLTKAIAKKLEDKKKNFYFLAYSEEEIVGLLQILLIDRKLAELILVYVVPKFRNQGIGKYLISWGLTQLKNWGIKFVRVEIREKNYVSQKIFSSFNPSLYSCTYTISLF